MGTIDTSVQSFIKSHCIAITGGIATGKSTVSKILKKHGYTVIDADQLSRDAVSKGSPALNQIVSEFGPSILTSNGDLDRSALRQKTFASAELRKKLESILHPAIVQMFYQEVSSLMKAHPEKIFFYEASLIHELGKSSEFKATWCTYCSEEDQIKRITTRSNGAITPEEARRIISSQMPQGKKLEMSSVKINTESSLESLESQVISSF